MPRLRRYRIFISHAWRYDECEKIKDALDSERNFCYSDYSVPSWNSLAVKGPRQLGEALRRQMSPCHIVLVFGGMEINFRTVIQFEISVAQELGKPILVVLPRGSLRAPKLLMDIAADVVGWNRNSIVTSIRRLAL
jgi:hypothetical protein